jgi:hypothetical protein
MKNHKRIKSIPLRVLAVLGICATAACAGIGYTPRTLSGQVQEQGTNRPIAGAILLVRWYGTMSDGIAHSTTVCYDMDSTVTDAEGKFFLPGAKQEYKYEDGHHYFDIEVYKKGFTGYLNQDFNKPISVKVKPQTDHRERVVELVRLGSRNCYAGGDAEALKKNIPFKRAIYEEMRSIATTDEDWKTVENMLFSLESEEFGRNTAEKNAIERRSQRQKKDKK